jgi:WD40 repeat protein
MRHGHEGLAQHRHRFPVIEAVQRLTLRLALTFLVVGLLAGPAAAADASDAQQLLYLATWPHQILVFDTAQEKIVDRIDLDTDAIQLLVLAADKKRLYANTVRDNSIVVIDLASRKVLSKFALNSGNRNARLLSFAADPSGKYLYSVGPTIVKQIDHYEVEPNKLVIIDLENRKISQMADFPKDETLMTLWPVQMKFSPDGKYLYIFQDKILIFDSKTLQLVKKIDLADPHVPGVTNVMFNPVEEWPAEDPNEEPGKLTNVFIASDPYVHRAVFGIAKIDLASLSFDFTPVAPATTLSMTPLLLTPAHQTGYTVTIDGSPGNRRGEFWVFDMKTRKLNNKKEFEGRNRFSFAMSADGRKIFIYGAGYEIGIYDAKTFELRNNVALPGDMTSNIVVMPLSHELAPSSASAVSPQAAGHR